MRKDFTKTAFQSKLFKGRSNWYFCFLKSEKLAHVLTLLAARSVADTTVTLKETASFATQITREVALAAAGEVKEEVLLASLFSIISTLRIQVSQGYLSRDTSRLLSEEYETMIEKLVGDSRHLGLTVSPHDLEIAPMVDEPLFTPLPSLLSLSNSQALIKDTFKGQKQPKTVKDSVESKGHSRTVSILELVRKSNGASIKDISAIIRDCSEKTIQRELNALISQGLILREGERRWSTYRIAQ